MVFEETTPYRAYSALAKQTAGYACKRLNLSPVSLNYFRPTDKPPVKNGRAKGLPWTDDSTLKGSCSMKLLSGKTEIWIRDRLKADDLIVTVAHEIYHLYEYKNDIATNEQKAEYFGRKVLSELALQSQMINYSFM